MHLKHYYSLLNVSPDATPEEIKKAYHTMAKKNHPDVHPPELRHSQQLKMMKINEAYMGLTAWINNEQLTEHETIYDTDNGIPDKIQQQNQLGTLKDPAYTYYKLGFDLYNEGHVTFHKRFSIKEDNRTINLFLGKRGLLNQAVSAIQKLEESYNYFVKVVTKFPDSIWVDDAYNKLTAIEKLNTVYEKICRQISERD